MKFGRILTAAILVFTVSFLQPTGAQVKKAPLGKTQYSKRSLGRSTARRIYSSAGTYLVITHHSPDKCLLEIDNLRSGDSIWVEHSWFGCLSGDHTVYTLIDAANIESALQQVPSIYRENCKVLKVNKVTADLLEEMHKEYRDQKM